MPISPQFHELLIRPSRGIVHFNDVFSESAIDFDAQLTTVFRNLGQFSDMFFPVGKHPEYAGYGAVLLDDLFAERKRIIHLIEKNGRKAPKALHEDETILCIINNAPRSKKTTEGGKNGKDFYLAITVNGLEIYTVPVERLSALETRNKILALYKIPNDRLRVTDGSKEQFRSSLIATTRYFPEILETVFEYENTEALLKAKENGTHPQIIPEQEKDIEFAFSDKFGNIRISVKNSQELKEKLKDTPIGGNIFIQFDQGDKIPALYVESLSQIPSDKIGLYHNIADTENEKTKAHYWELVRKLDDPNDAPENTEEFLTKISPNFKNEEISISLS